MVDRPNPGEGVTGGEGKEAWELHRVKAHLRVVLGCEKGLGARASTVSSGGGARATAAGWFQWGLGEEKGG